jgi:hypothetical protein
LTRSLYRQRVGTRTREAPSITGDERVLDPTQDHLDVSLVELRVLLRDVEDHFGLDLGARRSLTEAGWRGRNGRDEPVLGIDAG